MTNATAPEYTNGLALLEVLEFDEPNTLGTTSLKYIFQVEPDSNLYRQGKLPLVDLGREVIDADSVLKRDRIKFPMTPEGKVDGRAAQALLKERNDYYTSLDTWYIQILCDQESDPQMDLLAIQLHALQEKPKQAFDRICTLSSLNCSSYVDSEGKASRPRIDLPPVTHPNLVELPDTDSTDHILTTTSEIVFTSLIKDPFQTVPGIAIEVENPDEKGAYIALGDLFVDSLKDMDTFGFLLNFSCGGAMHILVMDGKFYPTRIQTKEGFIRLSQPQAVGLIQAAATKKPMSPEEKLLRNILGGK